MRAVAIKNDVWKVMEKNFHTVYDDLLLCDLSKYVPSYSIFIMMCGVLYGAINDEKYVNKINAEVAYILKTKDGVVCEILNRDRSFPRHKNHRIRSVDAKFLKEHYPKEKFETRLITGLCVFDIVIRRYGKKKILEYLKAYYEYCQNLL